LVITGPRIAEWGYKTEEGFMDNATYRAYKNKKTEEASTQ
jgi:hypothetical protein